jgi:hypothetical protein
MDMLMIYLIGRYIKLYYNKSIAKLKLVILMLILLIVIIGLNYLTTFVSSPREGISAPFSRDCSIVIICLSVNIFLLFKEIHFTSRIVNFLASSVTTIYISEGYIREFITNVLNINILKYSDKSYFYLIFATFVIGVMSAAIVFDIIRKYTIGRLENPVADVEMKLLRLIKARVIKLINW